MGDSEGLVDQEALESSITNEEVSEVQEEKPNSEINEESNNKSNEPQESGVAVEEEKGETQELTVVDNEVEEEPQNPNQQLDVPGEEKGEAQELTIVDNEVEEEPQNPNQQLDVPGEEEKGEVQEKITADNEAEEQLQDPNQLSGVPAIQSSITRQQSLVKSKPSLSQSFQNSPSSIDRHIPQQAKSHMPLTNVVSVSRPRINPRTGREIQSNIAQTSSVWEKIPLAKVLCPSWTKAQGNEVIEWEAVDINEVVVHTEGCQPIADEAENGDQPPVGMETKPSGQVIEEPGSQYDQPPPPQDDESGQKDQPSEERFSQQPGGQQSMEQQNTTEVNTQEDSVRVSQKSGKKMRDSTIQTSRIWERKPLAQILPHSGNKADSPSSTQKSKEPRCIFNWPDPFEF